MSLLKYSLVFLIQIFVFIVTQAKNASEHSVHNIINPKPNSNSTDEAETEKAVFHAIGK